VRLTWIDPTDGSEVLATPASDDEGLEVRTPGVNAEGETDWLLLVTAS
jgi:hypothetical protein